MRYVIQRKSIKLPHDKSVLVDIDEGTIVHAIRARNSTVVELMLLKPLEGDESDNSAE